MLVYSKAATCLGRSKKKERACFPPPFTTGFLSSFSFGILGLYIVIETTFIQFSLRLLCLASKALFFLQQKRQTTLKLSET